MDLMVALSTNDRNADIASVERLAKKLSLQTAEELKEETQCVQKLLRERRCITTECQQQVLNLLEKFKILAGVEINEAADEEAEPKPLTELAPISVPSDFLCPITLEIMTDPVIIATGLVQFTLMTMFVFLVWILFIFQAYLLWRCRHMKGATYRSGWSRITRLVLKRGRHWSTRC